jgi:hypothetical protein
MWTEVETVHMGAAALQELLECGMDEVHIGCGAESQGNASLVGHYKDPQPRMVEPCDRFGYAREQVEVVPGSDITLLRHLFVQDAVAVKEYRGQGMLSRIVNRIAHPAMIAIVRLSWLVRDQDRKEWRSCPLAVKPPPSLAMPLQNIWRSCAS